MLVSSKILSSLKSGTSALAIGLMVLSAVVVTTTILDTQPAFAAGEGGSGQGGGGGGDDHDHEDGDDHDHEDDEGGGQGGGGQGGGGQGGGGQGGGGGDDHDHEDGDDHDDGDGDDDKRGPGYGKPEGGETGGQPVWAGEGIPEVELGRLNVARSPAHVIDLAFEEAMASFTDEMAALYNMTIEEAVVYLSTQWDLVSMIDSPLQNLALLRDALDGTSDLNGLPLIDNDVNTLMAIFLGAASDKVVPISEDTVLAVTLILGFELTPAEIAQLAADAEAIRQAILTGHG